MNPEVNNDHAQIIPPTPAANASAIFPDEQPQPTLDSLHDTSHITSRHLTQHVDDDLDAKSNGFRKELASIEKTIKRDARLDVALGVAEHEGEPPTLSILRKKFTSFAAHETSHATLQATSEAGHFADKAATLAANHENQDEIKQICPGTALHNRLLGPRALGTALICTFLFELCWNAMALGAVIPGSRIFITIVAALTAALFVLAAHFAGLGFRYGRHHRAAYVLSAVLVLIMTAATIGMTMLRANAANAQAAFAAMQRSLASGSSGMSNAEFHPAHIPLAFIALSVITVLALILDVVTSYFAAPPHPAVPRLEALRAAAAQTTAELHTHKAANAAWGIHAEAVTSILRSELERLSAIYTREVMRHHARLARRRRLLAALRKLALPAAVAAGLLLAVTGHAAEMPVRTTYAVLVQTNRAPTAENPSPTTSVTKMYLTWVRTLLIPALHSGDRLIMAPISADYGLTFAPTVDASLPPSYEPFSFGYWFGHDNQRLRITEQLIRIRKQAARLILTGSSSRQACIIASLVRVAPFLMQTRGRKDLLLLSDGEDNCGALRFPVAPPTRGLVASLESRGLIPNLFGVHVWVAGAWAPTPRAYRELRRFWLAYFKRAGAILHEDDFAYTLNNFPHFAGR